VIELLGKRGHHKEQDLGVFNRTFLAKKNLKNLKKPLSYSCPSLVPPPKGMA
jgi:hypothetical protein